ncbi:MAG: alpha/beta fold hydrolase [Mariniphaga sp.]|nr:alpha/beta fold hydrolase [Mariniphaga sp.]MDD4227591.1 alpha/beta fold hydrolase [Mariniphaga sp.]MDD4425694.1 alpha/beta fold hydrolase [Mariniphaga sp.]
MKTKINGFLFIILLLLVSCSKEIDDLSIDAYDEFAVRSDGNDMLVKVVGNTESKIIILFVHGGPGEGSWIFSKYAEQIKKKYALALWDQANSGSTQGNNSGDCTVQRYIDDLGKVVKVLKHRYGDEHEFYLMGHSCGGGFSVGYLGTGSNQNDFKGFINVAGAHKLKAVKDYQLIELPQRVAIEIAKGNTAKELQTALDFCNDHKEIKTVEEFSELSLVCAGVTDKIDSVHVYSLIEASTFLGDYSFFSYLSNWSSLWKKEDFIREIFWETDFTDKVPNITIPTLVIWGKFDINLSKQLMADEYMNLVGSTDKKLVLCEHSGHYSFANEPDVFFHAVDDFIQRTK